ncbi:MAG: methyltransferase domain-containing protein [Alphaproteobacteria bacterium]|nr:MAG: methyltransferase domain-containing protein [Alphaproteobacteria bacterium]
MRPDILTLSRFYRSPLGCEVAASMAACLVRRWGSLVGLHCAGVGYPVPLFARFGQEAASRILLMPAAQGVMRWPEEGRNAAALVEESAWPLPPSSIDRLVCLHALESADDLAGLLREVWRVLTPAGRAIFFVPRRRSLWSGAEKTPFGHGRPFSRHQLDQLLATHLLAPREAETLLFFPPWRRGVPRAAQYLERFGRAARLPIGGLLAIEAQKQVFGALADRVTRPLVRRQAIAGPVAEARFFARTGRVERRPPAA